MRTLILLIIISAVLPFTSSYAGGINSVFALNETDTSSGVIYSAFDLRDRESYVQVTNLDSGAAILHIQVFNVGNLCNENNFFDTYTPNDTHVYNLRDILSNDGNPSGVVLPDNAYGIIFISAVPANGIFPLNYAPLVGNFRIIDNTGYEYRSNIQSLPDRFQIPLPIIDIPVATFNYNSQNGTILSDVFGIPLRFAESNIEFDADLDNVLDTFAAVDVDIIDNNEVLFSCRDVIFACIDENSPLIEELIQIANNSGLMPTRSSASVARFEYGINESIPNSKGGELLCPGNIIDEGIVKLTFESSGDNTFKFAGYIGLNNGNGRGSMDSFNADNPLFVQVD